MSTIESVLQETRVFPPPAELVAKANISGMAAYEALCKEAERDFEGFWARQAREALLWYKPFTKTLDESKAPFFRWFHDGELNASYNCLDRHLRTQPDKVAIIFEADDGKVTKVTYKELYHRVCQLSNALKAQGVNLGDRVLIYMPMSIEAVVAMQACARIGATHSVVFGGFSAKSLQERIIDAGATEVITADGQFRGGKEIPLKPVVDEAFAMGGCEKVHSVIVYKRSGSNVPLTAPRDKGGHEGVPRQPMECETTWVEAEPSRCVDVVPHGGRRRALPDRRHLVADRNRRAHDHPAAGGDAAQARIVHAAAAGNHHRHRRRDRAFGGPGQGRDPRDQAPVARHDPHDLGRSGALQEELLPGGLQGQVLPRRRRREHRR